MRTLSRNTRISREETAADRARRFRWRIWLLSAGFVAAFLVLAGRAVYLMGFPNERLEALAERQHTQVITLYPKRGMIYDRHGAELARSVDMDSIYADPKFITDIPKTARDIASILGLDVARLEARLSQKLRFVWIARRINEKDAEKVRALKLPGIYEVNETRRFYPNRELAGAVLGFTDVDNMGIEGLERTYNEILNGKVARYVQLRDAKGRNITPEGVLVKQNTDGCHLELTLDRTLQFAAEKALSEAYTDFNCKGGFIVALDPRTGEILALANTPGYNPNAYGQYEPSAYKNQAVANSYEPGSTQKVFLVSAALNERVVQPDEMFDCEGGKYRIGRNTIHDTHPYGVISVRDIIRVSSNIGAAKIADRLGKQRVYDYYRAFGFGQTPRAGLPGEINALLYHPRRWSRIGLATHGFGQGMTVTGLQVASALATIANGGTRMRPFIIRAVRDQFGNLLEENAPRVESQVISPDTARTMTDIMAMVTRPGGTGTNAAVEGYTVAGKTGTAQKVDSVTRRYGAGMYISSFVGYLPAEDPRLVIAVVMDEPHGKGYYGGTVSAPAFAKVARAGMQLMGVPPSPIALADADATPDPNRRKPKKSLVEQVTFGDDAMVSSDDPTPEPLTLKPVVREEEKVEEEEYILPDFRGQTMRTVFAALDDKVLALEVQGHGVAVAQVPAPGEVIKTGEKLKITFDPAGPEKSKKGAKP